MRPASHRYQNSAIKLNDGSSSAVRQVGRDGAHRTLMRRCSAVLVILACEGVAQGQDSWLPRLASKKYETRESAVQELTAKGVDCLPIVAELLRSKNHDACRSTRDVLVRLGPVVIPFLMSNLRGDNADARYYSIGALGDLAPDSAPAVPLLADALGDADDEIVYEAAWALAALREKATPAVAALASALRHDKGLVRTTAAGALAAIGAAARDSAPALLATLDDGDASTRRAAAEALASIGLDGGLADGGAVARLVEALADENIYVRMSAARALGTIGPAARAAVRALEAKLESTALAPDVTWALERITGKKPTGVASMLEAVPAGVAQATAPTKWVVHARRRDRPKRDRVRRRHSRGLGYRHRSSRALVSRARIVELCRPDRRRRPRVRRRGKREEVSTRHGRRVRNTARLRC